MKCFKLIDTLKSTKENLALEGGSKPKFCSAGRPVPYAMKPKVAVKGKCLEGEGILHKVKFSSCSTPIVPVVKPNGPAFICGGYTITVNPQLQTEKYPLPRIDDIFAELAGEKSPRLNSDRYTIQWAWRKSHKST